MKRLEKQLKFIIEVDKLKSVIRKTRLFDGSKCENDSEHSWHISIMALLLSEYSNEKIDILKVIKMLLIHDIPEIYAGDYFLYHPERKTKAVIEEKKLQKESSVYCLMIKGTSIWICGLNLKKKKPRNQNLHLYWIDWSL